MNEDVEMVILEVKDGMDKAIRHFSERLNTIRAGKAAPEMVHSVSVEAYGVSSSITAVAGITTPDARTIVIQPFDKSIMSAIERAIINSNLGFNPMNDGSVIRINIPALTQERRMQLVKMAKNELETAKVAIRSARKDGNEEIKKLVKDGVSEDEGKLAEDEIQKITNDASKRVEELLVQKEKDIMTV